MQKNGVIVGLDVGEVRTGIARSDALQLIAFPHSVVFAQNENEMVHKVAEAIQAISPVLIVVGMPLDQYGQPGAQAKRVATFIERLKALTGIEVVTQDERFSTAEAHRVAATMEVRHKTRKKKVDQVAAALILQTFLDRTAARDNTSF